MNNSISITLMVSGIVTLIVFVILFKRDRSKRLELVFSLLLSFVFFIASIWVDNLSNKTEQSISESLTSTSPVEQSSHEKTSPDPTDYQKDPMETSIEELKIKGNSFSKKLSYTDEKYTIRFNAPKNGTYRFDYEINDVNCNYKVILMNSKKEIIFDSEYSVYENGNTCTLIENEKYTLIIEQSEGFPLATIKIGVPSGSAVLEFEK